MKPKIKKGFTTIELVAAIAVVAVIVVAIFLVRGCREEKPDENEPNTGDVKALIEDLVHEISDNLDERGDIVLFTADEKGDVRAFGYRQDERVLKPYKQDPVGEVRTGSFIPLTENILENMVISGALEKDKTVLDNTDRRHPERTEAMVKDCGFDTNTVIIRADYIIKDSFFEKQMILPEPTFALEDGVLYFGGAEYSGIYAKADGGNGLYYKNGRPLTGDAEGYAYLVGRLLITANSVDGEGNIVYNIPDGDYVTDEVQIYLPFSSSADLNGYYTTAEKSATQPSGGVTWKSGFEIKGAGEYKISKIGAYVADPDKNILYALTHGKPIESSSNAHIPSITDSAYFIEYLEKTFAADITKDNFSEYKNKYIEKKPTLPESYTDFLKEKLGSDDLLAALDGDFENVRDNLLGTTYGETYTEKQIEPAIIDLVTKALYNYGIIYSFGEMWGEEPTAAASVYSIMNESMTLPEAEEASSSIKGNIEVSHTLEVWTPAFAAEGFSSYYPNLLITVTKAE